MQINDIKYIVYAQGTMSQDGRMNALYQRKSGAPAYTTGAYADKFDKAEADRRTAYKGKYKWIACPVNDAKMISDYNRVAQERKLTSYSLEFRNRLRSAPEKAKSILFEAHSAYDNVVDDADEDDKKQVRESANKHWNDLQKFAESLKVSTKDKLIQSSSEEAFNKNVATEIKTGKDPKQAAAIAYSIQKENDSDMKDSRYKFNLKPGSVVKEGNTTYTIESISSDDVAVIKYADGRKYKKDMYDIVDELQNSPRYSLVHDNNEKDSMIRDGLGLANLRALINTGEVDTSRVNTTGEVIIRFKNDADKKDAMRKLYQHRVPIDSEKGLALYIDAERILSTVNDSMIRDAKYFQVDMTNKFGGTSSFIVRANSLNEAKERAQKAYPEYTHKATYEASEGHIWLAKRKGLYIDSSSEIDKHMKNNNTIKDADMFNITFERNGVYQSNLVKASSEEEAKQKFMSYAKKHNLPNAKIISVSPNKEGYRPDKPVIDGESIKDAPPVDVLGIVQSKRDNTGKTWYLLSISTKSGNKGYLVTGEYDGGFHHSGGGAVSFNLNTAKADMDAFITIANLKSKYGEAEGYKRYMAGQKDSSSISSNKIKDFDSRTLAEAEKLANQFEKKCGENTTTIKLVYDSYDSVEDAQIDDDWSRGVSVTVKVDTNSLIAAAKAKKVRIGSGWSDNPEKLIGQRSLRFGLPNGDNTAYVNLERSQSSIHYNMYDNDFTYKELGGKADFNKAKLTSGLKDLQNYVVSQLTSANIRVYQSKVEVGGSSQFNSVWRQAQSYNDSAPFNGFAYMIKQYSSKPEQLIAVTAKIKAANDLTAQEKQQLLSRIESLKHDSLTDAYNKFANEKDVDFLKESLSEMRRYERNWSGMSAREKQNIAPGGISELRENIRNAEAQLKKISDNSVNPSTLKVIAKKALEMQDGCSRHYLEVEDCDGKRFYMVTDEYDGCSKQFSGSGSVIEDKATLSRKYKDDLASGLRSVGQSAMEGAKAVKSKLSGRDEVAIDSKMYATPLDNLIKCGQVKDGVSVSKVDAMLGINNIEATKQLLRDANIKYSPVTAKVSEYRIVDGKCVKADER